MPSPSQFVSEVDRMIYGAVVLTLGAKASDGRTTVDAAALQQLVKIGNAKPIGIKALFGRPTIFKDKLGEYLGRWVNFRLSRDKRAVWADLKLSKVRAVRGDLGSYVLAIAREDPDALGADHDALNEGAKALGQLQYRIKTLRSIFLCDDPFLTAGGLFGDVQQPTSRPKLAAKPTYPKGIAMSPAMKASMQKSMQAAEDRVLAQHSAKAGTGFVLTLDHYADSAQHRIPLNGLGLTIDEMGAANDPKFKMLAQEYACDFESQKRYGVTLVSYVSGGWSDEYNAEIPPAVKGACEKLQKHFGEVYASPAPGGWVN